MSTGAPGDDLSRSVAAAADGPRTGLDRLMWDVLRRRAAGERLTDDAVQRLHPEFMPQLADRLAAMRGTRQAFLASRRVTPSDDPVQVLDDAALERPITVDGSDDAGEAPTAGVSVEGYAVGRTLGAGGQATVYQAVQESTGRTVALKVMLGGAAAASRHRRRFDREVRILASLDHPNLVRVIERGVTADGSMFFAMDHVDGVTIEQYVAACRSRPDLPPDGWVAAAVVVLAKVARAVEAAHERGVVHRDLKPSNILVDRWGEPRVLDFGLARPGEGLMADHPLERATVTHSGQLLGSLPWTSPEQIAGRSAAVDGRADVYALGVVAYHLLTGEFPYDVDGTLGATARNIEHAQPPPPSQLRRHAGRGRAARLLLRFGRRALPTALDRVVLKALAKRPEDRHASAGRLADDLENVLGGLPVSASPARRRRYVRTRGALLVVGVAAALAVAFAMASADARRRPAAGVDPTRPARVDLPPYTNSYGMRFVWLGPHSFMMGSLPSEAGRRDDEPRHAASVDGRIWMGVTEVTRGQYRAVMEIGGPAGTTDQGDGDFPMAEVSWNDAVDFCRRLSERAGRAYRLPDEREWECACRATMGDGRFSGASQLDVLGWYAGNSGGAVHLVATRSPNGWGIFDMHGNVAEWCRDGYDRTVPRAGASTPPTARAADGADGQPPLLRVIRGGSAGQPPADCRAAARDARDPDTRSPFVGFRVVMVAPAPGATSAPSRSLTSWQDQP